MNSMKGEYSKSKFFINYPSIHQIYYQGLLSITCEDIKQLFKKADDLSKKYIANNENKNIMILFDELGFAEYAQENKLKVLKKEVEYDRKTKRICFIGISNNSLNSNLMNSSLCLSVTNLEDKLFQLKSISKSIEMII